MIEEPVTAELSSTKEEVLTGVRVVYLHSWIMWLLGLVILAFVVMSIAQRDPVLIVTTAAELLVVWWFVDGVPRRKWKTASYLRGPRRVTVGPEGVREANERGEALVPWAQVRAVRHVGAAYYFWTRRNGVVQVPDRALSVQDHDRLAPLVGRGPSLGA